MGCAQRSYIAAGNVRFNYAQLMGIWIQAGGSKQQAPLAAAVAMAESGGNSANTLQDTNCTTDRGLWQINSSHGALSTYDPMGNARAAVSISCNGNCSNSCSPSGYTGWGNWSTYCSGAYLSHMQSGVQPDTSVPINATNAAANQPGPASPSGGSQTAQLAGCVKLPILGCQCMPWDVNCVQQHGEANPYSPVNLLGDPGKAIKSVIGWVLNPLIQWIAGALGLAGGSLLMLLGMFLIIQDTKVGRAVTGVGITAAGAATGQPEVMAAGTGYARGGATGAAAGVAGQRTATIRGQQVEQRQGRLIAQRGTAAQQAAQTRLLQQQSRTEQERIRQEALTYRHVTPRAT